MIYQELTEMPHDSGSRLSISLKMESSLWQRDLEESAKLADWYNLSWPDGPIDCKASQRVIGNLAAAV